MPLYLLSKDSFLGKVSVLPKIETFAGVFDGVFSAELILKLFEGLFRAKIKKEAKKDYIPGITALSKVFLQRDRPLKALIKRSL